MAIDVSIWTSRIKDGYLSTTGGGTMRSIGTTPYAEATASGGAASGVVYITMDQRIDGIKIFDSSIRFEKDVSIVGKIRSYDTITNDGDVSIGGDLYVDSSLVVLGNYYLYQDVSVGKGLWVNLDSSFLADLYVGDDLIVGSVNIRDYQDVQDVSIYGNTLDISDLSTNIWNYQSIQDASISALEASIGTSMDYAYVDGSLALRDTSIAWLNTNKLHSDASISDLSDVSLGGIGSAQDGSSLIYDGNGYWTYGPGGGGLTDVSLGGLTDVSVSDVSDNNVIQYSNTSSRWENRATLEIADYFQKKLTQGTKLSNSSGSQGDFSFDASYLYICTSTNTWIRILGEGGY